MIINFKYLHLLLFIAFICLSMTIINDDSYKALIMKFERKYKIDTTQIHLKKCVRKINKYKGKIISISYDYEKGIMSKHVGTEIIYNPLNTKDLLRLGTWATAKDSFLIQNTDTVVVFSNPFPKIFCYVDTLTSKSGFSARDIIGHAYQWTKSGKLLQSATNIKGSTFKIIHDTITGKVLKKTLVK